MKSFNQKLFLIVIVFASIMFTVASFAADTPQPIIKGDITYISGGIGDEDREALETTKKNYNLIITSAKSSGSFIGETQLIIYNKLGDELLNTSAGPLFYAHLPNGQYIIEATMGDNSKKKNITIKNNTVKINFLW
jgi:hypothetical protein